MFLPINEEIIDEMRSSNQFTLLVLVPVLFSCASQSNSEEVNAVYSIGQKVTEIDSKIYAIHQDTDSNYWFGSGQNGVYYSNGKTIIHYSTKDGLVSDNIFAIDEDHLGNLFFSTTKERKQAGSVSCHSLDR